MINISDLTELTEYLGNSLAGTQPLLAVINVTNNVITLGRDNKRWLLILTRDVTTL